MSLMMKVTFIFIKETRMLTCRPVRRLVAQGPMCSIEECACGVLHVTLGVLTLRLHPDVVASIAETFADALRVLAMPSVREHGTSRTNSEERPS